jgi:hypothetical protein
MDTKTTYAGIHARAANKTLWRGQRFVRPISMRGPPLPRSDSGGDFRLSRRLVDAYTHDLSRGEGQKRPKWEF